MKKYYCKNVYCKKEYTPLYRNGIKLSSYCVSCLSKKGKEKEAKQIRKETKEARESMLTKSDYIKMLQIVFNAYIRERDRYLPCISCGCSMVGRKGDASHFYSAGGNPAVRFNEDNVHLSCVPCNQHKHGNLLEYAERLPARIGLCRFENLKKIRNKEAHYSIPELKEMIAEYKKKIKELKNN